MSPDPSCEKNLAGDPQSIAQCQQDFSYEYLDAVAACKSAARTSGAVTNGKFGTVLDGQTPQTKINQSVMKGGLKLQRN